MASKENASEGAPRERPNGVLPPTTRLSLMFRAATTRTSTIEAKLEQHERLLKAVTDGSIPAMSSKDDRKKWAAAVMKGEWKK